MFICKYCGREFSNAGGHGAHHPYCKSNPERTQRPKSPNAHAKKGCKGHAPWNKGLTKENSNQIKLQAERSVGRFISDITKQKCRNNAISKGLGGPTKGGRGKKGRYKGFWCDSSWELAYLIFQLDHNTKVERCKDFRLYNWEGCQRKYYPDFIVDGTTIEIKGYKTKQWEAKRSANPDIICLYLDEMKPYIDYAVSRYGRDFIRLYETEGAEAGSSTCLESKSDL